MSKKRGIFALLAGAMAVALCFVCTTAAFAHEAVDQSRTGSLTISMTYEGQAVSGGSLELYRVGDVSEDDGNFSFTLSSEFAGSGVSLDDVEAAGLADDLAAYATAQGISGSVYEVDGNGNVSASGLTLGLYLVTQPEAADGYEAITPFLVSVPMYDEVNESYVYDVDATPKVGTISLAPEEPEEPVEETPATGTDGSTMPKTGESNWMVPVLVVVGVGLVLVGAAVLLRKRSGEGRA